MVEYVSWHWIFLVNVPVGLIGLAATLRFMPVGDRFAVKRFDGVGYALLAFGMVAVSLALDSMSGKGIHGAMVFVLLIFGLASLAAYWLHALRRPDPLFAPSCSPCAACAWACWAICSRAWAAPACPS